MLTIINSKYTKNSSTAFRTVEEFHEEYFDNHNGESLFLKVDKKAGVVYAGEENIYLEPVLKYSGRGGYWRKGS